MCYITEEQNRKRHIYILALTRTHIHAFTQRRPRAKRQTEHKDWSTRLVPNLSPFRSPIDHHVDSASMGMHRKFGKLRVLPGNLKTLPTWSPCLVRGKVFLGVKVARTGLRSESISTRAILCRQEQRNVAKSHAASTEAILETVPAALCRQEQRRTEQNVVAKSKVLSTHVLGDHSKGWGGLGDLSGQLMSLPGRPGARLTWPQGGVLWTRAMVTGARFCRQPHCFIGSNIPGGRSSNWDGLRSLFGRLGGYLGGPEGPV